MKRFRRIGLLMSMVLTLSCFLLVGKETSAQVYTDSLTFKIDSARMDGDFLVYSVMFWRTNQDWSGGGIAGVQDTLLGNTDLYFWIEDVVFDKNAMPNISRRHPMLKDVNTNLLVINANYYARRFLISLRNRVVGLSDGMGVVPILWNKPVELCQVKMKMNDPTQNPGLRWDTIATGGQSTIGEPLILTWQGDMSMNPDKGIELKDYSKKVYACQGEEAKIWAKGHSAGTDLQISWYMSKDKECRTAYGNGNGVKFTSNIKGNLVAGQTYYTGAVSSPWGQIVYRVSAVNDLLERVDTLTITHVPAAFDSIYFQCELSDASLGQYRTSTVGATQLLLRDSLFGWLAASDPSKRDDQATTGIGASDRTDTIMKCPSGGAIVSFYFFGPECGTDKEIIGNKMEIEYQFQDALGNGGIKTASLSAWQEEQNIPAPNNRCLYKGTFVLNDSIKDQFVWLKSIATEKGCHNGVSYAKYDTVYVREIEPDGSVRSVITDTILAAGESFDLKQKPGFNYTPSLIVGTAGGALSQSGGKYTYKAPITSCTDAKGCADTILYTYDIRNGDGSTCKMEVEQTVRINDWYYLNVKVLLEGALKTGSGPGEMSPYLGGMLPRNPTGQYESLYDDTKIPVLPTPPTGKVICDWMQICLRDASNLSASCKFVDSVSVFLLTDGSIMSTTGDPFIQFKDLPTSAYYILIRHRNHLMTMSSNLITLSNTSTTVPLWDATVPANVYGGNIKMVGGHGALYTGDVNQDNIINAADLNLILRSYSQAINYYQNDLNFDTIINAADKSTAISNMNKNASY